MLVAKATHFDGDRFCQLSRQITNVLAREKDVDLIAMTTHGHRFISDVLYGATADKVRHAVDIPVLLVRAK